MHCTHFQSLSGIFLNHSLSLSKTLSLLILNLNSFNWLAFVLILLPLSTRFHKFVSVKSKSFSYYLRLLLGFGSNGKYQLNVHFLSLRESWRPVNFLETPPFSVLLLLLLVLPFFHLFFLFYYFIDFCLDLFFRWIFFSRAVSLLISLWIFFFSFSLILFGLHSRILNFLFPQATFFFQLIFLKSFLDFSWSCEKRICLFIYLF